MPVVQNTIEMPGGEPATGRVVVTVITSDTGKDVPAYVTEDNISIEGAYSEVIDENGSWGLDLIPNIKITQPENTVYKAVEYLAHGVQIKHVFEVLDVDGPLFIGDIATMEPASLTPPGAIPMSQKGIPFGVATLDSEGRLTIEQMAQMLDVSGIVNAGEYGLDLTGAEDSTLAFLAAIEDADHRWLWTPPGIIRVRLLDEEDPVIFRLQNAMGLLSSNPYATQFLYEGEIPCAMFRGVDTAGIVVDGLSTKMTAPDIQSLSLHMTNAVYGYVKNYHMAGDSNYEPGTFRSGGILFDTDEGGHVPPQGSYKFENVNGVSEPPDAGDGVDGLPWIHVKGRTTPGDGITHVIFDGYCNLEHAKDGIKLENVGYIDIGTNVQLRGNSDAELHLINCEMFKIRQPEIAPSPVLLDENDDPIPGTGGRGLVIDDDCRGGSVDVVMNTSSGAPRVTIDDQGQGTIYPGQGGPTGGYNKRTDRLDKATQTDIIGDVWVHIGPPILIHGREGDWVSVDLSYLSSNQNEVLFMDAFTLDGTNCWGADAPLGNAQQGVQAWRADQNVYAHPGGSIRRQLKAEDAVDGLVRIQLVGRVNSPAGTKSIYPGLYVSATNHGPQ